MSLTAFSNAVNGSRNFFHSWNQFLKLCFISFFLSLWKGQSCSVGCGWAVYETSWSCLPSCPRDFECHIKGFRPCSFFSAFIFSSSPCGEFCMVISQINHQLVWSPTWFASPKGMMALLMWGLTFFYDLIAWILLKFSLKVFAPSRLHLWVFCFGFLLCAILLPDGGSPKFSPHAACNQAVVEKISGCRLHGIMLF